MKNSIWSSIKSTVSQLNEKGAALDRARVMEQVERLVPQDKTQLAVCGGTSAATGLCLAFLDCGLSTVILGSVTVFAGTSYVMSRKDNEEEAAAVVVVEATVVE